MYKDNSQLRIEDFVFPYGELDAENDCVRLAAILEASVPKAEAEKKDDSDEALRKNLCKRFSTKPRMAQ